MARWRIGDATYLVDEIGGAVARDDGSFRELPLVVGEGAADDAMVMIRSLDRYPAITRGPCGAEPHRRPPLGPDLLHRACACSCRRIGVAQALGQLEMYQTDRPTARSRRDRHRHARRRHGVARAAASWRSRREPMSAKARTSTRRKVDAEYETPAERAAEAKPQ